MIILGSTSKCRKEILDDILNQEYIICAPEYEEDNSLQLPVKELAIHHSVKKAESLIERFPNDFIIGSDCLMELKGEAIGKPKDIREAKRLHERLRGHIHKFHSGLGLYNPNDQKIYRSSCSAEVEFDYASYSLIDEYLKSNEWKGMSGAYQMDGLGFKFIKNISGDYYAIKGLPIIQLMMFLTKFGAL